MEAVNRRESDAIQEIYKRYESALRSVIQSVLHDEGETDDALNDVFVQLWDHADRFNAAKGLHGFLVTLARRRALAGYLGAWPIVEVAQTSRYCYD